MIYKFSKLFYSKLMTLFETVDILPDDPIFGLLLPFNQDPRPYKVNLCVGAYRSAEGRPQVLSSVKKAELRLMEKGLNKEYSPIDGDPDFIRSFSSLIFGENSVPLKRGEISATQTVGGTGALRLGAELLANKFSNKIIYISDPSWANHELIFSEAGFKVEIYPYYDANSHRFDFAKMCEKIEKMPPLSVILLHACCHNPTGFEPSFEEWKTLLTLIQKKRLIPFFDMAYQGYGEGLEGDAKAVRYFVENNQECLVASSCSKNFGLYGERVGLLSVVTKDLQEARGIQSHIKKIVRSIYSMPPLHGARIVAEVLTSPDLESEWREELKKMQARIHEMRMSLSNGLGSSFSHLREQKGIFSFTGLKSRDVERLQKDHAIYMTLDGRINVAGLNIHNIEYVVEAITTVIS